MIFLTVSEFNDLTDCVDIILDARLDV
jgi:hypothetical protein